MNCFGVDVASGRSVEISFDQTITRLDPAPDAPPDTWLAPGLIDLQVNGFAGVDYNDPAPPHDEIARSLRALFATGVTRFYPTVITGPPDSMQAALRNLSRARDLVADG